MVFPVAMYGCESWRIKKAECGRTDAFELWCWRRLLRVPWAARRSNQSIPKESSPGYSLEGLMLKLNSNNLATWCEQLTHLKRPWCWEWWRQEEKGTTEYEMVGWHCRLNGHEFQYCGSWWWTGRPGMLQFMGLQRVRHNWATELNWTEQCSKKLIWRNQ